MKILVTKGTENPGKALVWEDQMSWQISFGSLVTLGLTKGGKKERTATKLNPWRLKFSFDRKSS